MTQTTVKLSNGVGIPQFGLGVYQIPEGETTIDAVKTSLRIGYRHIDTAHAYQNERSVGKAIRESGIARADIWVTSKLWPSDYTDPEAVDKMLARLGLETIDLVLLHQQVGDWKSAWRMLEKVYGDGKVRSIGISNFDGERLAAIYDFAKIKPQVIQVETHPYYQQSALRKLLSPYGTVIEAWYPLGHGDKALLGESEFTALATKYGKSSAQIILRWHIQEGTVIFPRSTSEGHLAENIDIFDFELTASEMDKIRAIDKDKRYFTMTYKEQKARFEGLVIAD